MNDVYEEEKQQLFTPLDISKLVAVIALGAVVGLLIWGLMVVIDRYILDPVLCQGQALQCANTSQYSEAIASIVGAGVGLFFLVRLQVFRPLLVVVAAIASLWGIIGQAALLPWYGVGLSAILLYAFAYAIFTWVARIRSFPMVVIVYVVLVAAVRVALSL
jgi:uncharacterized membrane protein YbhN (UPF0104 family)